MEKLELKTLEDGSMVLTAVVNSDVPGNLLGYFSSVRPIIGDGEAKATFDGVRGELTLEAKFPAREVTPLKSGEEGERQLQEELDLLKESEAEEVVEEEVEEEVPDESNPGKKKLVKKVVKKVIKKKAEEPEHHKKGR